MFKDITEPLGGKSASLYNKNMLQEFKQKKQNKQTITTILFQRNTFKNICILKKAKLTVTDAEERKNSECWKFQITNKKS